MRRNATTLLAVASLGLFAACGGSDGDAAGGVAALDDEPPTAADGDVGDGEADADGDGDGDGEGDHGDVDPEAALLAYTQCMRDSGVPMPDPQITDSGGVMFEMNDDGDGAVNLDEVDMDAAFEQCGHLLDDARFGGGRQIDESEMQDQMLEFTQCMRAEAVDVDDPDFSGAIDERRVAGQGEGGAVIAGPFGTLDLSDPAVEAALDECAGIFGEGAMFGRGGR